MCQDDQPDNSSSNVFPFGNVTVKTEPIDDLSPPTTPPDHLEADDETSKYISDYILGLQREQEQSMMKIFQPKQEQLQQPLLSPCQPLSPPLSVSPKQPLTPPLPVSPQQPLSPNQIISSSHSMSPTDGIAVTTTVNQKLQSQAQHEDLSLEQLLSQPVQSEQILKILQAQQMQVQYLRFYGNLKFFIFFYIIL